MAAESKKDDSVKLERLKYLHTQRGFDEALTSGTLTVDELRQVVTDAMWGWNAFDKTFEGEHVEEYEKQRDSIAKDWMDNYIKNGDPAVLNALVLKLRLYGWEGED